MACTSLTALPRTCGAEGILAGLEKVYMISANDLAPASGTAGDPTFTVASNGIVSAIGTAASKNFVEIGLLKSTAGLNEELVKNPQNGSAFFNQTFTLVLSDLTVENKNWVENVINQPVAVLIKSRTGKYYAAGLTGQLELSALTGGTGVAEGDTMGYNLTFSGVATKLIPQVDPTIIAALIS